MSIVSPPQNAANGRWVPHIGQSCDVGRDKSLNHADELGQAIMVDLDLSRFCSGQVLLLSGLSFERHGAFPAQC